MSFAHHPAAEAAALVGADFSTHVLEPSPPAVHDEPFFADDPATVDGSDRPTLTPTSGGDRTWDDLIAERPELATFASDRWLGARPRLPAVPAGYVASRNAYHRLAYSVMAEARRIATTKFGLRYTRAGFGTPFFGDDEQIRVEGTHLIRQRGGDADAIEITTLRAAAGFVGVEPGVTAAEHDSPELGDLDETLAVDADTGRFLGAWFGLAWAVLEELRLTPGAHDVERTQLWPGHFDAALAMGDPEVGGRATYGLSPGDHDHDEPYLYVGAWGEVDRDDPYWNETSFNGASLSFAELAEAPDPTVAALLFFRKGFVSLNPS